MQPLLAEILSHPTDYLAIANIGDLKLSACNNNLVKLLGVDSEKCKGKSIYSLLGKKVSREKTAGVISELKERNLYIDKEADPENHIFFSLVNCQEGPCCLIRISNQRMIDTQQQYRGFFEKNLAGIYKSDIKGKIILCNNEMARILGYSTSSDVIGKSTKDFYDDPHQRQILIDELKKRNVLINYEFRIKAQDGTLRYCLTNSYLERFDGEEFVSGTMLDITDKKDMENALQESEMRFKSISEVTHEGVLFMRGDHIVDCNDQFARMMGFASASDLTGKEERDFFTAAEIKKIRANAEISPANRSEIRVAARSGKPTFIEVSGSYLQYRGQSVLALVTNDITSRKRTELALQQSALGFRRLLENSPNGVVIITEGKIKYVNNAACELFGAEDEDTLYNEEFIHFIAEDYKSEIRSDIDEVRDGQEIDYKEIRVQQHNGDTIDVGIKSTLTAFENKPSIQVTLNNVMARNQLVQEQIRVRFVEEINSALKAEINEHKETQRKLEQQQRETTSQKAKLESIFNSTENLMMWTINHEYVITGLNKNFTSWMFDQFGEQVQIGDNIMGVLQHNLDRDYYQGQLEAFNFGFKGRPQQFEFPLLNSKKQTVWLQAFLNPVYIEGKLEELSCLLYDNTERKEFDRKIRDSLKEKEVLLQEVHHRVKNNLQVISSILNLQSSYVDDPKTLEVLRESQQRIKSMSFIHETIYRTADFSKLEFTDYVRAIAGNLVQSYRTTETTIQFVDEMDAVYLNLDQSIPCGLIINELVSNALKYAFRDRKKGKLTIRLRESDNLITLMVKDDGVGLPDNFSYEKTNSLGIQLVYALLEQLDATMNITNKKGAEFLITFHRK